MFDNPIYNYPIVKVLEHYGYKKGQGKDMYCAGYRGDTNASLHVNPEKNVWMDFGTGTGGDVVRLVMEIEHCSRKEAENIIRSFAPQPVTTPASRSDAPQESAPSHPKTTILSVSPLTTRFVKSYIESRGIPTELAGKYCKEVLVENKERGRTFNLIGFENNQGGFTLKAPSGFKSTNKVGITTINTSGDRTDKASSTDVNVFEGFFDFLSWMVIQNSLTPSCDVVVLNSTTNFERSIGFVSQHSEVRLFLDNDESGRCCRDKFISRFPEKTIQDMSGVYSGYKDMNEMLVAMMPDLKKQ